MVIVPMSRDQLYPALSSGKVDMVAAMVTVRPELEKLVAFSEPTRTDVSEVVVTGPGAPPIATVDDLAGQEVFVRKASTYYDSLDQPERATEGARQAGGRNRRGPRRAGRRRHPRDGQRRSRADHRGGRLPGRILEPGVHRSSTCIATSPCAPAATWRSPFARRIRSSEKPSTTGCGSTARATRSATSIERRYLQNIKYAKNAAADNERRKLLAVVDLFKKYGDRIQPRLPADGGAGLSGVDARPERQESRSARSA